MDKTILLGATAIFTGMLGSTVYAQTCNTVNIQATTPNERFTDNHDGTVTDTRTHLMWKKCSEGFTWNSVSGGCDAPAPASYPTLVYHSWEKALDKAETINTSGGFAGHTNWRVPNPKELLSLTEEQCTDPAINLNVFPNTPGNSNYWSSSPYVWATRHSGSGTNYAFAAFIHRGSIYYLSKPTNAFVRMVRDSD